MGKIDRSHELGEGSGWRILAKCHERRNLAEYEGSFEIEDQLLNDLLNAKLAIFEKIKTLVKKGSNGGSI